MAKVKKSKMTPQDAMMTHVRQTAKRSYEVKGGVQVHQDKRKVAEKKATRQAMKGGW